MKTPEMSDANNSLRNKTRTPNIFQNVEPSLASPTPTAMTKLNDSNAPLSPNTTVSPNTKSMMVQKLQTLKQRKLDLDKLLIEKNNLLQQLCREEAKLIGRSTYSLTDIGTASTGIDCGDGSSNNNVGEQGSGQNNTLRRRIDTGFKLPENLLNSNEDDINQLLLSKKIQQQISQASLRLANDVAQTKSIRRAHKQNYDVAQQKIQSINQSLSMLKKCQNIEQPITTRDDINIHKFNNNNNNIHSNMGFATINNVINTSKNHGHSPKKQNLNNNNNNSSSNLSIELSNEMPERRNSAVSAGSASQYLSSNALKSRSRCESYSGGAITPTIACSNTSGSAEKMMHSPTIVYYPQQFPHLHYSNHADKVFYVTNAVANAAAQAAAANSNSGSLNGNNPLTSPKYGRLRKPLTVDTNISEFYYPPSGSSSHQHRALGQPQYYTQQHQHHHRHSPYTTNRMHLTPNRTANVLPSRLTPTMTPGNDDDEDIAGQYATLLSLSEQPKQYLVSPQQVDNLDGDTHYTEILCRKQSAPLPSVDTEQKPAKDADLPQKKQGLGGYWTTNENNERVWCSMDNRYSSLDRKSHKNKLKKHMRGLHQPTKSSSLGNFNFLNKSEEMLDEDEQATDPGADRRSKDKPWIETSLDDGPLESPISPPIYYREKNRLSSHSMHSPSRNAMSMTSQPTHSANVVSKSSLQSPLLLSTLTKTPLRTPSMPLTCQRYADGSHSNESALDDTNVECGEDAGNTPSIPLASQRHPNGTSATTLSAIDNQLHQQQMQQKQPLSPPYYHNSSHSQLINNQSVSTLQSPEVPSSVAANSFLENSSSSFTTNVSSADIHVESPKNVTIVQPAKFQPYKEVTKPFEMSDFYKYSTKFRQKTASTVPMGNLENQSPQLPPKNVNHQHHVHTRSGVNL